MRVRISITAVYLAMLGGAFVWLGMITAAPWLVSNGHHLSAAFIYQGFSTICHQIPERSFYLYENPLAVCSRCTGIYTGGLLGIMIYPLVRSLENEGIPSRAWLAAGAIPTLIDFTLDFIGAFQNTGLSRLATGAVFGAVMAFFILPGMVALRTARPAIPKAH